MNLIEGLVVPTGGYLYIVLLKHWGKKIPGIKPGIFLQKELN